MAHVANFIEISEPNRLTVLENRIVMLRKRLHQIWEERGCIDDAVLAASTELDQVLNEYQRLMK